MKSKLSQLLNQMLFCFLTSTRRFRPLKKETGKVLLVHFAHIGDFIIWLDSAKAYRKLFPNKQIVLLCRKFKNISIIAESTGLFDQIVVVDDSWSHRIGNVLKVMRDQYDVVINTRATRDMQSDIFVLAPRSCERIAPSSDYTLLNEQQVRCSDRAYTKVIPVDGIHTMELIRNAQFVRKLGMPEFRASLPVLPTFAPPSSLPPLFFAVCVGANTIAKCWPEDRFATVIDAAINKYHLPCVLIGAVQEYELAERVRSLCKDPKQVINFVGTTTLTEYIETVRAAKFLLTNDTSAGHIAPAVKTPSLVIHASWDYGRFFPYEIEEECTCIPYSVSASVSCCGCGKDPTRGGYSSCLDNGVMRCLLDVTTEDVLSCLDSAFPTAVGNAE